jgi:acyl-CoA synthetase (AMP-forming)/AMP-acid ligase II/alkylation response protein AidB-like acyl-CoA dehydrogenase/acyl carrier protein
MNQKSICFATAVEVLRARAAEQPSQRAYTFLVDGKVEGATLTYSELDSKARSIAAFLQQRQAQGERVMLLYPQGLEVIAAFLGCLYAGVIAIPVPPPESGRLKRTLPRLKAIARDAQAKFVLTTAKILALVEEYREQIPEFQSMTWIDTEQIPLELAENWFDPQVCRENLAYLQYTSGSTSTPKGVMISHGNLIFHSEYLQRACGYKPDSATVTWMPYFHDYGLVEGLLQPLFNGTPCFVMSPFSFIKRPIHWLQAISRYQATHSQAPNFAYDQCVRRISIEDCQGLDLSHWQAAGNAAEPINPKVLERFFTTFEPFGFRWHTFSPAYGLAEATLLVSSSPETDTPVLCQLDAAMLEKNYVVDATAQSELTRTVVGCGRLVCETQVKIVNPETLVQCAPNEVGEIWASDPSVAQGYWNRPQETEQTFRAYIMNTDAGPFLRTGDLGFIKNGELFISGRLKDLIIIRGTNHYPQDIEWTVQSSHPALRAEHGAAFAVEVGGVERLVITQEVERHHRDLDINQVIESIRQAIADNYELDVYAILLLKTGSILKTSSGKIQRQACRLGFLENNLDALGAWIAEVPVNQTQEMQIGISDRSMNKHATFGDTTPTEMQSEESQPRVSQSKERADALIGWLRSYAKDRINSRLIDERRCIPPYIVLDLGNHGCLGMQIPEQYGGSGLGNEDAMRVIEQLAAIDLTLATFVVNNDCLSIRPIQRYGTPALRAELLPQLASGRELAAFALSEPGAGSNPQAIAATGISDAAGGWRLSGTKVWSGSAGWAGVINVFVKLMDAQGKPQGITGFAVRQGTEGLRCGSESLTMGMRGMVQSFVHLDQVPVTATHLLGAPGAGMVAAQDGMLYTRLAIGAMCVGGMKRCAQLMLRYATRRAIGTGRLLDNPVTLARMSDLTAATTAFGCLVTRIAQLLDQDGFVPAEAYVACKTAGPEFLWKGADTLVQLLGGRGYLENNIAAQILRDARVFRIFEGPTETLTMFLGSRVLHENTELHRFLSESLGAPAVSLRLREAADLISRASSTASFLDPPTALRWTSMLVGELATYGILLAALQGALKRSPSGQLRRAAVWVEQKFEQSLAKAVSDRDIASVLLNAQESTDLISSYTEMIGDLEQTCAGEEIGLDNFLRLQTGMAAPTPQTTDLPGSVSFEPQPRQNKFPVAEPQTFEPETAAPNHNIDALIATPSLDLAGTGYTAASIQAWLVQWIANELKTEISVIDPHKSFVHYGMDSVTAIMLISDLEVGLGRELSPALAWNYPVIADLAQQLAELMAESVNPQDINLEQLPARTLAFSSHTPELANGHNNGQTPETNVPDPALPDLQHLSDQEVDALLSQMLNAQESEP